MHKKLESTVKCPPVLSLSTLLLFLINSYCAVPLQSPNPQLLSPLSF